MFFDALPNEATAFLQKVLTLEQYEHFCRIMSGENNPSAVPLDSPVTVLGTLPRKLRILFEKEGIKTIRGIALYWRCQRYDRDMAKAYLGTPGVSVTSLRNLLKLLSQAGWDIDQLNRVRIHSPN